jgi:hypothetical protein
MSSKASIGTYLEDLHDLRLLHHVLDGLVDHAGERRDEEAAVGDHVVEAPDQLHVAPRDPYFLLRLA